MRIFRLSAAFIFILFIALPLVATDGVSSKAGPNPGNLISMDFQDANLKTVLKVFSQQSGLNFVASQNVQDRTVTVYFDGVSVKDALEHIMDANNLVYEQEPGSNIFIVKESGAPAVETLTKIYELKYAQLMQPPTEEGEEKNKEAEIISVVQGVLSKNGKVIADKRSNSLIITDVPSQFAVIEDVLARLDTRTPQVMIEAEIIETSTTVADKLGISWSGAIGIYKGPMRKTIWPLGRFENEFASAEDSATAGTVDLSGMTATLRAILNDTDTRILARPKVLTLNNETAKIELTAQTAVASITTTYGTGSQGSTQTSSAERIDTGITLEVTPQINKDGYVTMYIEPSVIVPVASTYFKGESGGEIYVDPQKRSTKSTVRVKDGETIVIGGLISKEDSNGFTKVPFLGDIPLLGLAFRYKSTDKSDKELLIFLTTHIVKEPTYVLGRISEREQEQPKVAREKEIKTMLDLLGGNR